MRPDRRWILAGAVAIALLVAVAVTVVLVADDGNDPAAIATTATTASTTSSTTTVVAPAPSTTLAPSATPAPATTTSSTAAVTSAPARCARPSPGSDFDGFGAVEIVIANADGPRRSCVLTADSPAQQQQGLMRQDDLDGYDGMLFRFATAEERSFWMRNTQLPLSIAFFDAGGAFVSAVDMEPCGDRADCPSYSSRGAAKFALEVMRGRLPATGATAGSRLLQ